VAVFPVSIGYCDYVLHTYKLTRCMYYQPQ